MASGSSKTRKWLFAATAVALLLGASFLQRDLGKQQAEFKLTHAAALEGAPPVLQFTTVALGAFRGLIANVLWIRASDLQDDGKYFEMVQLADWITKLQPHITTVWIHQAWNLAYNISVKFDDPNDRWLWVSRGIELLRDQALRYNPREPLLYRELGWFFQHKMGHYLDDAHNVYKARWINEMSELLGGRGQPNFEELLNPQTADAQRRVRLLREKYKMDPQWMKEVDDRYGPLEWRLPECHAIYWATVGLEKAQIENLKQDEYIMLRRVVFQSMQMAFQRGRLVYPTATATNYILAPNLSIVRQTSESYEEMARLEPARKENILNAHKHFLKTAVYFLYMNNRHTAAREWFNILNQKYPDAVQEASVDDYALARITDDVDETDPIRIKALLDGMFETAFFNYAIGEEDQGLAHQQFARKLWQRYQAEIGPRGEVRVGLPPIQEMEAQAINRLLDPTNGLDPALAGQLRSRLGLPSVISTNEASLNAAMGLTNTVTAPSPPPSGK